MQNYWAQNFILPQRVLKKVARICISFLWFGRSEDGRGAKVSWKSCCNAKEEGGLGIKDLKLWNQVSKLRYLWDLFAHAGSVWVAWCEKNYIKGQDLWHLSVKQGCSWSWRKILQLSRLASRLEAAGQWNTNAERFSNSSSWKYLKADGRKVLWRRLAWGSFSIPRHCFITWLVLQNILSTKDRLLCWGLNVQGNCLICADGQESRDHLYFSCQFGKEIWSRVLRECGLQREANSWQRELDWMILNCKGRSPPAILLKLAWNAAIYYIWRERNARAHGQPVKTAEQVFQQIRWDVSMRLKDAKYRAEKLSDVVRKAWDL